MAAWSLANIFRNLFWAVKRFWNKGLTLFGKEWQVETLDNY
jgi:hypothetical protein